MNSELEGVLSANGALFGSHLGGSLPVHFGDPEREWRAAREGAVVFATAFRALLTVAGDDRVSFLQGMLSNDVKALAPGSGVHALQLDGAAKVIADMRVYADEERFLLDVLRLRAETVRSNLDRYLVADDVDLSISEDEVPLVGFGGPRGATAARRLLHGSLNLPRPFDHLKCEHGGRRIRVAAAAEWGGPGLALYGPPAAAAALFAEAVDAGIVPVGMETLNVLRIEAGVPWAGIDIDESVLAMETNLDSAISFSKGCYLGQETVERVSARGHVNRKLTGLVLAGDVVPPPGALLRVEGREVGRITSAVRSPRLERVIALGYVHRRVLAAGSELDVLAGDSTLRATVTDLPFCKD